MDIDLELNRIIVKYGLNVCYPEWTQYFQALEFIKDLFSEIPEKTTVAIRGAGKHTVELLKVINELGIKNKVSFIVDYDEKCKKIDGIRVITPEEAKSYKIDVYIVSSYRFGLEMEVQLWNTVGEQTKIINLYDYFRKKGLNLNTEFYNIDFPYITYPDIYCCKNKYRYASNAEEQKVQLQILIFQCIEIRDFISSKEYIDEYIRAGFDDGKYQEAWNSIEKFLKDIEKRICARKCKDIIINWIDAVEYSGLGEMEYINEICRQGLVFDNAFTPIPWTHTTMASMFLEKLPIEGKTYLFKDKYTSTNSPFLKVLEMEEYAFKYIAYPGLYENDYMKEHIWQYQKSYKKIVCSNRTIGCSTRLQWMAVKERMEQDKAVCLLVHNLAETHDPFMSTRLEGMSMDLTGGADNIERRTICRKYLDEQLRYYSRFNGKNVVNVYMTDHGRATRAYTDDRSKVLMALSGNISRAGHEDRIYSHLYFNRVIQYIIHPTPKNYDNIFCEYAFLENLDIYNSGFVNWLQNIVSESEEKIKKMGLSRYFQYRAIRTKTDLYVRYANGKELYFVLPDDNKNLIEDEKYQNRIEELKAACGNEFIDIESEAVFCESSRIYKLIENLKEIEW